MDRKTWIFILKNKEQNNGLESIGSIVTENDDETNPIDDPDGQNNNTTPSDNSKDETQSSDTTDDNSSDSSKDDGTNNVDDDQNQGDGGSSNLGFDKIDNFDTSDNSGDTSDDGSNSDTDSASTITDNNSDVVEDPMVIQQRLVLLSNKILKLYDSIENSITLIINGQSFKNKPVIINKLNVLKNIVNTINESLNKEDHRIILFKYSACVKNFNRIVESISI